MMQVWPSRDALTKAYEAGRSQVAWTTLVADLETTLGAMMKVTRTERYSFLLESIEGGTTNGRYSYIGFRPDLVWRCRGQQAEMNRTVLAGGETFEPEASPTMDSLRALIAESEIDLPPDLPPGSASLIGFFAYDFVRLIESLPSTKPDELDLPDAVLMRPTIVLIFDNVMQRMTVVTTLYPAAGVAASTALDEAYARLASVTENLRGSLPPSVVTRTAGEMPPPVTNQTREQYYEMVEKAKTYIRAGDVFQVVPSQRFSQPFELPALALYRSLRRLNPSPFSFYLDLGDFSLVGSSPEILVRLRNETVTIRPIAGTRRRGSDRAEDVALEEGLLADPKECAEHLMLLDLGRNDVGRVAKVGSMRVTSKMAVERYSHVMHIVSNVEGELDRDRADLLDVLCAGFPAGTVSGAPKIRAMEIIEELEPVRRSFYAGGVGYIGANGNLDTCISLRTGLLMNGRLYVQAGGGVVADSDPEAEYQESCNKAQAVLRAAKDAYELAASETAALTA